MPLHQITPVQQSECLSKKYFIEGPRDKPHYVKSKTAFTAAATLQLVASPKMKVTGSKIDPP